MDINILLFDNFTTLDAFGPVEILGRIEEFNLRYFSLNGGIVSGSQGVSVVTEPIKDANKEGILLVPGGMGARTLVDDEAFIATLRELAEDAHFCLSVCTGSALFAKAGLLDGKRATSNKLSFDWVKSVNANVHWVPKARWVVDGKYFTSSGVSAGMDMALGFIEACFGKLAAQNAAMRIEYIWNDDPNFDPFAK